MNKACSESIVKLIEQSKRKVPGRIRDKEVRGGVLISALFKGFRIKSRGQPSNTESMNRSRIQGIMADNTMSPNGHLSFADFSSDGFIRDLDKEFIINQNNA